MFDLGRNAGRAHTFTHNPFMFVIMFARPSAGVSINPFLYVHVLNLLVCILQVCGYFHFVCLFCTWHVCARVR